MPSSGIWEELAIRKPKMVQCIRPMPAHLDTSLKMQSSVVQVVKVPKVRLSEQHWTKPPWYPGYSLDAISLID